MEKILPQESPSLPRKTLSSTPQNSASSMGLNEELVAFERKKLEQAISRVTSTRDMADLLGISQSTAVRKLKRHGLSLN